MKISEFRIGIVWFRIVYGIEIAVMIFVVLCLPYMIVRDILKEGSWLYKVSHYFSEHQLLLPVSIGLMLSLVLIGILTRAEDKPIAGAKIQTAGYLYTLIGFSAALFDLSQGDLKHSLRSILVPLGSALITSIIGWFAGGEIGKQIPSDIHPTLLPSAIRETVNELGKFTQDVSKARSRYIETIDEFTTTIDESTAKVHKLGETYAQLRTTQNTLVNNTVEVANKLNEGFEHIVESIEVLTKMVDGKTKSVENLITTIEGLATAVQAASHHIHQHLGTSFAGTLSEIHTHANNIEITLANIDHGFTQLAELSENVREKLQQAPQGVEKILQEFIHTADELHKRFEPIFTSVEEVATKMTATSSHLDRHLGESFVSTLAEIPAKGQRITQELTNAEQELVKLVNEFKQLVATSQEVETYLWQSRVLIDELQKLIPSIARIKL